MPQVLDATVLYRGLFGATRFSNFIGNYLDLPMLIPLLCAFQSGLSKLFKTINIYKLLCKVSHGLLQCILGLMCSF